MHGRCPCISKQYSLPGWSRLLCRDILALASACATDLHRSASADHPPRNAIKNGAPSAVNKKRDVKSDEARPAPADAPSCVIERSRITSTLSSEALPINGAM